MAKNVMIVDDEIDIRVTVKAVLGSRGFDVLLVESGQQCIEELEKGFKGVILMDVMMPDMDGWETVKEISEKGLQKGNIISMLTAKHEPDPALEELAEYVIYYIRKPFEPTELVSIVSEYCELLEDGQSVRDN